MLYTGEFSFFNCNLLNSSIEVLSEKIEESAFEKCKNIADIKLRIQVKYIGEKAFKNCEKLEELYFPSSIEKIESEAFEGCTLKNIELTGDIKTIYTSAFAGMKNVVETFSISNTKEIVFFKWDSWNSSKRIRVSQVLTLKNVIIYEGLFHIYSDTKVISNNVKITKNSIDNEEMMQNVKSINNVRDLMIIEDQCVDILKTKLKNIILKEHKNVIFNWLVFLIRFISSIVIYLGFVKIAAHIDSSYSLKLKILEIATICVGTSVIGLSLYKFTLNLLECYKKKWIKIKKLLRGKKKINSFCYAGSSLVEIEGEEVILIEKNGLAVCTKLEKINFPKLESIEENGLAVCTKLEKMNFPELKIIGEEGCRGCRLLKKVELPKVEEIGKQAFAYCKSLNQINVGEKLRKIDVSAFQECEKLSQFYFPNSLRRIAPMAFMMTGLENVELPSGVEIIEEYAFAFTPLVSVKLNGDIDIKKGAFKECENLTIINWKRVNHISEESFFLCDFEKIELNRNITNIPNKAFKYNKNLKNVLLNGKNIYLENEAFYECDNLKYISAKQIKSVGERVFGYTAIEKLYFGNISYIAKFAFAYANELRSVFIKCEEKNFFVGENIFEDCLVLNEIWIDHDGEDEIAKAAFPHGIPIYVVQGSSIEKNLSGKGYTICPVSRDEMSRKYLTLNLLDQYETAKQKKEFNY